MRTLLPDELKEQPLVKLAIGFTLVVMVAFVVTGFFLYFQHMDLGPASVEAYYAGSLTQPARSVDAMLSVTHAHAIALGAALLLLSLLLIRSSASERTKKTLIVLPFTSAIVCELASWLVYAEIPGAAWLKIVSFLALELSLLWLIFALYGVTFRTGRTTPEPVLPARAPVSPQRRGPQVQQQRGGQGAPQGGQQSGGGGDQRRRRRRPRRRRGGSGGGPRQGGGPPSVQGGPTPTS